MPPARSRSSSIIPRATSSTSSRSSSRTSFRQGRRRAISRRIRFPRRVRTCSRSYVPNRSFTLVTESELQQPDSDNAVGRSRQGRRQDHHRPGRFVPVRRERPVGLRLQPGSERPSAGGAVQVQGPAPDLHEREHLVLLPQQQDPAVQQPQGASGGANRHRPTGDRLRPVRRSRPARRRTSCRRAIRSTRRSPTSRSTSPRPKQLVQQSGTAGAAVDVYGTNEEPAKATIEYLAGQLTKIGYKPKLHLLSHTASISRRSETRRPRPRPVTPTGTRTTRIRSTGSTCCSTATASRRRTTTTRATSTSRR